MCTAHSPRASGLRSNKFPLRELRIPPGGLHLIGNLYSLTLNCNTVFPIRKQSGQVCFIYGMSEHTQYAEHIVLPSQPERKDLDGLLRRVRICPKGYQACLGDTLGRSRSDIFHSHECAYYFLSYRKTLSRFSVTRSFL